VDPPLKIQWQGFKRSCNIIDNGDFVPAQIQSIGELRSQSAAANNNYFHYASYLERRRLKGNLHIKIPDVFCMGLNKAGPGQYGLSHQHIEGTIRYRGILDRHQ